MQKQKLDVLIAMFAYAGNGGVATVLPDIAVWLAKRYKEMDADERIGRVAVKKYGDIPLTMERNRVVKDAKDGGFDVIIMLDSDNIPDLYLGHTTTAKPFWETSFDFLYDRSLRNLPTVVCAPYCGPPPHPVQGGEENVYVFYAIGSETIEGQEDKLGAVRFEAYSREHAAIMHGIQMCAAGPTGCIVYSTDAFDLMPVGRQSDEEVLESYREGKISSLRAIELLRMESWFFYEFTDQYQTNKASTEDVTNTREIQFAGIEKHGEPVVFCNWDAWAGHMKPKCVGAPNPVKIEHVSRIFAEAIRGNIGVDDQKVMLDLDNEGLQGPQTDVEILPTNGKSSGIKQDMYKKETRLGVVFENPTLSEVDCELIRDLAEIQKIQRSVVIGDKSGELCEAVYKEGALLYGVDCEAKVPYLRKVKQTWSNLDNQDLDAVFMHANTQIWSWASVCDVWLRHLSKKGILVLVGFKSGEYEEVSKELQSSVDAAEAPFEVFHIEGSSIFYLQPVIKQVEDRIGSP